MPTDTIPTRATVAAELLAALGALHTAEQALLTATLDLSRARNTLQVCEDAVHLTDGALDGKNEATRGAQLRRLVFVEYAAVKEHEHTRLRAASGLERAKATLSVYRALARLVAGEE